jgi:hypothetical protein
MFLENFDTEEARQWPEHLAQVDDTVGGEQHPRRPLVLHLKLTLPRGQVDEHQVHQPHDPGEDICTQHPPPRSSTSLNSRHLSSTSFRSSVAAIRTLSQPPVGTTAPSQSRGRAQDKPIGDPHSARKCILKCREN